MAVKAARMTFRAIYRGGKKIIIPIRKGVKNIGTRKLRVLPKLSPPESISKFINFKWGDKKADFWIRSKHSANKLGEIITKHHKGAIGVSIKDKNKLVPDFMKYAFMNLQKNSNFYKLRAKGSLNLKHITTKDMNSLSIEDVITSMKNKRTAYEKIAHVEQFAISKKHLKRINLLKGYGRIKPHHMNKLSADAVQKELKLARTLRKHIQRKKMR